jgi:hypothetical protein
VRHQPEASLQDFSTTYGGGAQAALRQTAVARGLLLLTVKGVEVGHKNRSSEGDNARRRASTTSARKGDDMKRQISNLLAVFGLVLVAACANAQTLKANVPFDFVVDKATLSAGAYTIQQISNGAGTDILHLKADAGKGNMLIVPNRKDRSAEPSEKSMLVFHRYGGTYFLSQIWTQGDNAARVLKVSPREAEMAKGGEPVENVILLASLR